VKSVILSSPEEDVPLTSLCLVANLPRLLLSIELILTGIAFFVILHVFDVNGNYDILVLHHEPIYSTNFSTLSYIQYNGWK
jgi:hypothetical protein